MSGSSVGGLVLSGLLSVPTGSAIALVSTALTISVPAGDGHTATAHMKALGPEGGRRVAPEPRKSGDPAAAGPRILRMAFALPRFRVSRAVHNPRRHASPLLSVLPGRTTSVRTAELMHRIATGDAAALSELYDLSSRYVYGICLKVLRNPADAEEVALDVYTQAWRQAERFDAGRGEPLAWLLMLARSPACRPSSARSSSSRIRPGRRRRRT